MNEEKICSFFGHRDVEITDELLAKTTAEIEKSVDFGCRIFYFGGFSDFDALCYQIVTKLKEQTPEIKRVFCVPLEKYIRKNAPYFKREDYDEIIYLQPTLEGWYKSIYFRNCAMIDNSDLIIFCVEERKNSGAYKTYEYAQKKRKFSINVK